MKKGLRNTLVISLFVSLITTIFLPMWLGFGAGSLNKLFDEMMKALFGDSTIKPALFYIFGGFILFLIAFFVEKRFSTTEIPYNSAQRESILKELGESYQKRLNDKLAKDLTFEINLSLQFANQVNGESHWPSRKFILDEFDNQPVNSFDELFNLYTTDIRRLAIIGEPGAGKTVLLLKFANKLIKLAQENDNAPIPILLDLATWEGAEFNDPKDPDHTGKSFRIWLESSTVKKLQEIGLAQSTAKSLVSNYQILPLLDGLDEIPGIKSYNHLIGQRLDSMHAYFDERKHRIGVAFPEMLLTCRTEQYLDGQYSNYINPIHANISVEPVKDLIAELQKLSHNDRLGTSSILMSSLNRFPLLVPLLNTAFNIHIALRLAREDFDFSNIHTDQDLLDAYINFHLNQINQDYPIETSIKALSWFARNSKGLRFSEMSINSNAFRIKIGYYLVKFLWLLPLTLIAGYLIPPVIIQPFFENFSITPSWIVFVSFALCFFMFHVDDLNGYKAINFNTKKALSGLVPKILINIIGLTISLITFTKISGVLGVLILVLCNMYAERHKELSDMVIKHIKKAWIVLGIRILYTFVDAFYFIFLLEFLSSLIDTGMKLGLTRPLTLQHFTYTASTNFSSYMPYTILGLMLLALLRRIPSSLVLDHYVSKFILRVSSTIPKNTTQLLEKMNQIGLIEQFEDTYRFRHVLIQEWFIRKTKDEDFNLELVTTDEDILGVTIKSDRI